MHHLHEETSYVYRAPDTWITCSFFKPCPPDQGHT